MSRRKTRAPWARRMVALASAVGVMGLSPRALAQDAPPPATLEFAARSIVRVALLDLRATTKPTDADYRVALGLLSIAHELTPLDTEILRRQIEAAYAAGDGEMVLSLTRALLDLDGSDTVAQLRLITAGISQNHQNADDRIAAYQRILDPKGPGRRLDPALRSRLALDQALLHRERGDDAGFRAALTLAIQLDPTHKEAIQLGAAVFAERNPEDRIGRMHWLEMLLMADPVDPNIHLSIAHELADGGALAPAKRFLDNAVVALAAAGGNAEPLSVEAYVLTWYLEGPGAVATKLNNVLAGARDEAARELRRRREAGLPVDKAAKPEDVQLTPPMQLLYLLTLDTAGDTDAVRATVAEYAAASNRAVSELQDAVRRGEITPEQAIREAINSAASIHILRLWLGAGADDVRRDLASNRLIAEQAPALFALLEGWLAIRSGDAAAGLVKVEPLMVSDQNAAIAAGQAHEAAGNPGRAIDVYRRVARERILDPMGAWCRARMLKLGATPDAGNAAALEAAVRDIPLYIDSMAREPHKFVQLQARLLDTSPLGSDRVVVRVILENISDIPLGLGPDRPLSSRLLFAPKLGEMGGRRINLAQPDVVDLDRRLRLMPKERITADVWADAGPAGWLMEAVASRSIRVRWRVVQGFQNDAREGFRPGILGMATETDSAIRRPIPECSASADELAAKIAGDPASTIPRLAAAVRAHVLQPLLAPGLTPPIPVPPKPEDGAPARPAPAPEASPMSKAVGDAFAARYPKLAPSERAMLAAVLPHAGVSPLMAPVDQAMRAETDAVPLCVILATRMADAADPLLIAALKSDDPRVRSMAEQVALRLAGDGRLLARMKLADLQPEPGARK